MEEGAKRARALLEWLEENTPWEFELMAQVRSIAEQLEEGAADGG